MSQGEHEGMSVVCWFVEMLHVSVGYARQHTCCVRAVTQHERLRPYYRQGRIYVNKLLRQGVHIYIYIAKRKQAHVHEEQRMLLQLLSRAARLPHTPSLDDTCMRR